MRAVLAAELLVLRRRPVGRGMIACCSALPVLAALAYGQLSSSTMTFNDRRLADVLAFSGPDAAQVALRVFHVVMPLFILALAGQSWAGERSGHILREQWVRPVPRAHVYWAKTLSLWMMASVPLLMSTTAVLLVATPWLGASGPWLDLSLSVVLSLVTLLGLTVLSTFVAQWVRSTAAVIVVGMIGLGIDLGLRLGLSGLAFIEVSGAADLHAMMLGTALGIWSEPAGALRWTHAAALLAWLTPMVLVALRRVQTQDVT